MAINLVRFSMDGAARWGVASESGIAPLDGDYPTTAALIEHGEADWRRASLREPVAQFGSIEILPPVTTPCRLYCQGANYRQHMIESGMDPDAKAFNMFFTKSDASVASAREAVSPPPHVSLLDYEVELALVFRRAIASPVKVTRDSLKDFVFAVTIANDLSARDVQLPQMQFFKGKSYRGFCPIGPWLTMPEPEEFALIDDLDLKLAVNGEVRQSDSTKNLVFKPAETLAYISTIITLEPGDVVSTGTPGGVGDARQPPVYLRPGQVVRTTIEGLGECVNECVKEPR